MSASCETFNGLLMAPQVPTGAGRHKRVRLDLRRFLGRLGVGGVFQPDDAVVLICLTDDVPQTLFNHGAKEPTGIGLGDPQGMSDGGKKINAVGRGVSDIAVLDRLLAELFTAGVGVEVFQLDVRPGGMV